MNPAGRRLASLLLGGALIAPAPSRAAGPPSARAAAPESSSSANVHEVRGAALEGAESPRPPPEIPSPEPDLPPAPPLTPAPDTAPVSREVLSAADLARVPGSGEESARALSTLPGVSGDTAGPGTFGVRGAEPGQLVVLLDGVPLPGPRPAAGLAALLGTPLVDGVALTGTAAPADAPTSIGGVLAVSGWGGEPLDGHARDLDGAVVLGASDLRLALVAPIGRGDDLAFAFGARRSLRGPYLWTLEALDLLERPRAAPEDDALTARLAWRPGRHRFRLTLLRATGTLAATAEADRLVPVAGELELDDHLLLATLDHQVDAGAASVGSALSVGRASAYLAHQLGYSQVATTQLFARTDVTIPAWDHHAMRLGASGQARDVSVRLADHFPALPTWAAVPIGVYGADGREAGSSGGWRPEAAVYAEHTWEGPVHTRVGARATWVGRTGEVLPGPSAGIAMPLPTGTVARITGGLYHHVVDDRVAAVAPEVHAERAWQLLVGVDQALPFADARVRLDGHVAKLEDLAVHDDTGGEAWTNDGTGRNLGADLSVIGGTRRVRVQGHLSLLHATRTNPLDTRFPDDLVPGHAEAATADFSVAYEPVEALRLTGRWEFHAGRPTSSVEPGGGQILAVAALNDQRMGDRHTLDVRAEWRHATPRLRYSVYVDVLNVLNLSDPLLPTASVEGGVLAEGVVAQLPFRPWLGAQVAF